MQQQTTQKPEMMTLAEIIAPEKIEQLHKDSILEMPQEEQAKTGQVFIEALIHRNPSSRTPQKVNEIPTFKSTPNKIVSSDKSTPEKEISPEDKIWKFLSFHLMEFKKTEETLSKEAEKMDQVFQAIIKSKYANELSSEEVDLLGTACGHLQKLAFSKPFSCIPDNLTANSQTILNTFIALDKEVNDDPSATFLGRVNCCFWLSLFFTHLNNILQKICNLEGSLGFLQKNCPLLNNTLPDFQKLQSCLITPIQRMPRLALFSTEWPKKLKELSIENSSDAYKAVENLDTKFKKISKNIDNVQKLVEQEETKVKSQKELEREKTRTEKEENATMFDRITNIFSKEDETKVDFTVGETAFNDQSVYNAIKEWNRTALSDNRKQTYIPIQPYQPRTSITHETIGLISESKIALKEELPLPQSIIPQQITTTQASNNPARTYSNRKLPEPKTLTNTQPQITQPQTILPQQNITPIITQTQTEKPIQPPRSLPTPQLQTNQQQNINPIIKPNQTEKPIQPRRTLPTPQLQTNQLQNTTPIIMPDQTFPQPELLPSVLPQNPIPTLNSSPQIIRSLPQPGIPQQNPLPQSSTHYNPTSNPTFINFNIKNETTIVHNYIFVNQQDTNKPQSLPEPVTNFNRNNSQSSYPGRMYTEKKEKPAISETDKLKNNLYFVMTGITLMQFSATKPAITVDTASKCIHITIDSIALQRKEQVDLSKNYAFKSFKLEDTQTGIMVGEFKNATELNNFLSTCDIKNCDIKKLYGELCEDNSITPDESFFNQKPSDFFSSFSFQ